MTLLEEAVKAAVDRQIEQMIREGRRFTTAVQLWRRATARLGLSPTDPDYPRLRGVAMLYIDRLIKEGVFATAQAVAGGEPLLMLKCSKEKGGGNTTFGLKKG